MEFTTADLSDAYSGEVLAAQPVFRDYGGQERFWRTIDTIRVFEDNTLVGRILEGAGQGHVLVVDGGGSLRSALVGDVIAGIALDRGWAGLVLSGAVRDSAALDRLELGIKALGTNPRKSGKTGAGVVGDPVEIGGVRIAPGQTVHSDEDGIVVLPERLGGAR